MSECGPDCKCGANDTPKTAPVVKESGQLIPRNSSSRPVMIIPNQEDYVVDPKTGQVRRRRPK